MKNKILVLLMITLVLLHYACKSGEKEVQYTGNPLFEDWYADPEVAIYDSLFWIFPTSSSPAGRPGQVSFDAFSSPDLVNWTKYENIVDSQRVKWIEKALWAPATIKKENKYYLFFAANDIQTPESPWFMPGKDKEGAIGGIGVAIADRPQGPYNDLLGKPLINEVYNGAQPIDQFVFKHTDGKYYIVYGGWKHCNVGMLNDDFTALVPFEDGDMVKEITPEGYVEGPVMFMRKGKLYFMWSEGDWAEDNYRVRYSIADSPFGPFKPIGTILESDPEIATGAGHNSVFNLPDTDEWYIVYHRRPIPNEATGHRVTCIDRFYFNEDGTIQPIKMTNEGVAAVTLK